VTIFLANCKVKNTVLGIRHDSGDELVAAATSATAASAAAGGWSEGFGGATGCRRAEDAQLDGGFLAGTLGTSDFLLLVDYNFFEFGLAVVADVFVDGHFLLRSFKNRLASLIIASALE
jgi:hypothetical protein